MVRRCSGIRFYYTQFFRVVPWGGAMGVMVARFLALTYPDLRAHHITMIGAIEIDEAELPELAKKWHSIAPTDFDKQVVQRTKQFQEQGMVYALLHASRPQTIAYSFLDSPTGLVSWIYEKLHSWTDSYTWTHEEIPT